MAKVRVHELAKELGVSSKTLLAHLKDMGEFVKSASSTIEAPVVRRVQENPPTPEKGAAKKKAAAAMTHRTMAATAAKTGRRTETSDSIIGRRPTCAARPRR